MLSALRDAGMEPSHPAGAYYILANATRLPGANARREARVICSRATGVASVAGSPSSAPAAAKTCSASASPSRTLNWTKPATVCGKSKRLIGSSSSRIFTVSQS